MALACAMLSVFVVARRWAFIGEGIAHSGFGGAGTVWMLMLIFPSLSADGHEYLPYLGVVCFSIATAIGIGYFTRNGGTNSDAVIGIFLVASLAWGILAHIYLSPCPACRSRWLGYVSLRPDERHADVRGGGGAALSCGRRATFRIGSRDHRLLL